MDSAFRQALDEVGLALDLVEPEEILEACRRVASARRVGLYGCGREGLQLRGFAMRLFHLGVDTGYVGEMTMPPLAEGDLLIASSGTGQLSTVEALMRTARGAGAKVLFLTSVQDAPLAELADQTVRIPAQTMASDFGTGASQILPMGSAFEGALFFLFEIMIGCMKELLEVSPEAMRGRHTNME